MMSGLFLSFFYFLLDLWCRKSSARARARVSKFHTYGFAGRVVGRNFSSHHPNSANQLMRICRFYSCWGQKCSRPRSFPRTHQHEKFFSSNWVRRNGKSHHAACVRARAWRHRAARDANISPKMSFGFWEFFHRLKNVTHPENPENEKNPNTQHHHHKTP